MRLTIDTQKDSHEEIRKAIRMLSALVGESTSEGSSRNIFEDSSSVLGSSQANNSSSQSDQSSGGIFGFFDNADKQVVEEKKEEKEEFEDRVMEYY